MNYIYEDNLNFYDLINADSNEEDCDNTNQIVDNNHDKKQEQNNTCLISHLPLDITNIELDCKHKFNYYYLYHDIHDQKKSFNPYSGRIYRNTSDMIICPYCRKCMPYLLPPALDIKNVKSVNSVNAPKIFCLRLKCNIDNYNKEDILSKIEPCNDDLVYVTPYGNFCLMHYKIIKYSKKRKERIKNINRSGNKATNKNTIEYPNYELYKYERKYKLSDLREICKNNNIEYNGTKKDMIIRLYNNKYDFSK
jgi:uncharacterized CHY-type Zn-finger protein